MKKLILFLLTLIHSSVLFPQADSLFHQANQFYQQKNYEKAIEVYESLLNEETSKSIYYYEKANKADPDFAEAKNNLKFAEKTRLDEFENQQIYTSTDIWHQTIGFFTTEEWAFFAIAFLWIGAIFFLLFYFAKN